MWCCGVQSIDEMLPASGEVHEIRDEVEFDNTVKNKDSNFQKVVVFFNAVWCPPCRMIKTDFMELAQTHKQEVVLFLEVNIDKSRGISNACNVHSLPTFLCFNKGEMVEEVIGCDKARLLDAVLRLIKLPSTVHTVPELHSSVDRFGPHSFKKMFKKILNL